MYTAVSLKVTPKAERVEHPFFFKRRYNLNFYTRLTKMHLVTTRDAVRLTGLSTEQLREWTSRRALIVADIKPKGHGSPAQYSWQTILLLRLAVSLREKFKLELQAHQSLFASLSEGLRQTSFLSLWGNSLLLQGGDVWKLDDAVELSALDSDVIILKLDPHLHALSIGFSLPQPPSFAQFQLFPASGVAGTSSAALVHR